MSEHQQPEVLRFLDSFEPTRRVLLRAQAAAAWGRPPSEARSDLMAVLEIDPSELVPEPRRDEGFFEALSPDRDYERAVAAVAALLLRPEEREVAERLAPRLHVGLSLAAATSVQRAMRRTGFDEVIARIDARWQAEARGPNWEMISSETDEADKTLLELISRVAAPIPLNRVTRRRLDDLVAVQRSWTTH